MFVPLNGPLKCKSLTYSSCSCNVLLSDSPLTGCWCFASDPVDAAAADDDVDDDTVYWSWWWCCPAAVIDRSMPPRPCTPDWAVTVVVVELTTAFWWCCREDMSTPASSNDSADDVCCWSSRSRWFTEWPGVELQLADSYIVNCCTGGGRRCQVRSLRWTLIRHTCFGKQWLGPHLSRNRKGSGI